MSIASPILLSSKNPIPLVSTASQRKSVIADVAQKCLIELGVSLAIGIVSSFFTATLLEGSVLFVAIALQTVCNAVFRSVGAWAAQNPESKKCQRITSISSYLCMTSFAYLSASNAQALIHESGHAIAAKWMFQNANPRISIIPCLGGVTQVATAQLSRWGKMFGRNRALFFVTLMGPFSSLFFSGLAMAVGLAVKARFSELGYYLIGIGRGDYYAHALYAMTALSSSPSTNAHDFVHLRTYGIHPLVSAVTILAIPTLINLYYKSAIQKSLQSPQRRAELIPTPAKP